MHVYSHLRHFLIIFIPCFKLASILKIEQGTLNIAFLNLLREVAIKSQVLLLTSWHLVKSLFIVENHWMCLSIALKVLKDSI